MCHRTDERTRGDPIPVIAGRAALLYGLLILISLIWLRLRDLELSLSAVSPVWSLLLGVSCAALTFFSGYAGYRLIPLVRRLTEEMSGMFSGVSVVGLVALSVFSGVGEELFFRGTLQQEFGLVVASILFGLAHFVPDRRYLLWTVWAMAAGFLFGGLYEFTGGLLAPMVAHILHNAVTLLFWHRRRNTL